MSTRIKLVVGMMAVVVFVAIFYLTMQQSRQRYEVCVAFNGHTYCATAAGRTPQEATQAAHSVACTMLASTRDDNMVCMQTQPASIRRLAGN